MKHVIVAGHPAENSLTMSLTRAYAAELERLGHSQLTCDLYRMGFNPVLRARELVSPSADNPPSDDVSRLQTDLISADALTVIYPLWWLSMPAIMKGYIDRVFARVFAYEARNGVVRGLLNGKKAVLVTISGAPMPALVKSGDWSAVEMLQDTHIFRAAGFDLLEHLHFDEVAPNLPIALVEEHIERIRGCVKRHFSIRGDPK